MACQLLNGSAHLLSPNRDFNGGFNDAVQSVRELMDASSDLYRTSGVQRRFFGWFAIMPLPLKTSIQRIEARPMNLSRLFE